MVKESKKFTTHSYICVVQDSIARYAKNKVLRIFHLSIEMGVSSVFDKKRLGP